MKEILYEELIDSTKLALWLRLGLNALFRGHKGVGKTSSIFSACEAAGETLLYIPGSTCDPYTDFVGLPRVVIKNGKEKLVYVTRDDLDSATVIFIDEYNRAPKKVRNGTMELIQFHTINGKLLPNLKCVWAAINPYDENSTYDVEELDPAQEDRFHVTMDIPYRCSTAYFVEKHGEQKALAAIKWWEDMPEDLRFLCSPRKLDWALEYIDKGIDVRDMIPHQCNVSKLLEQIEAVDLATRMRKIFNKQDIPKAKALMKNDNLINDVVEVLIKNDDMSLMFFPLAPGEVISNVLFKEEEMRDHVIRHSDDVDRYKDFLDSIWANPKENKELSDQLRKSFVKYKKYNWDSREYQLAFGEVNLNCSRYSNDKIKDKTFMEHMLEIRRESFDYTWGENKKARQIAWNKFVELVPEEMTLEESNECLALLNGMATESRRDGTAYCLYEYLLPITNNALITQYKEYKHKDELIPNQFEALKMDTNVFEKVSPESWKNHFLCKPKANNIDLDAETL